MITTSVVIVNYNGGMMLTDCVRSALQQAQQVIVIDNASSDGSLEWLAKTLSSEKDVVLIHAGRNLGFAAACNLGIPAATGENLLFLNPDCILKDGVVETLGRTLEENARVGMAGPLLLNPDGTEQAGGRRAVPTPWRSFVRAFGFSKLRQRYPRLFSDFLLCEQPLPREPLEVEAISGSCMLVRRDAIRDVGILDESYFMHCEDLDWCMRFRQGGWKILFVPDASAVHCKGMCSNSRPIFVEWHKHKGMMRFYRKFFRHQYPGVLLWLVGAGVWLRFSVLALHYSARHMRNWLARDRG